MPKTLDEGLVLPSGRVVEHGAGPNMVEVAGDLNLAEDTSGPPA